MVTKRATMAKSNVSKLEYLKKYMDVDTDRKEKKSKKKKKVTKRNNIKIIDTSISLRNNDTHLYSDDEGEYDLQEEKPLMYAEDGFTVITKNDMNEENTRWKPLNKTLIDNTNNKSMNKLPTQQQHVSQRHDSSDSDASPVRQNKISHGVSRRHDTSDSDMSPVRGRRDRHDTSDSDMSPARHNRPVDDDDDDLSPVRIKPHNTDDDSQRVFKKSDRKYEAGGNKVSKREELQPEVLSTGRPGLRTGAELREENQLKRKRELEVMKNLDIDVSGKGAQTVHRDRKTGKKIDLKLEAIKKRKLEEEKFEHDEKYAKWGKGVAQDEDYQKQLQDDIHEMEKPLARYKDDKDLDVLLRDRDREGDPMLAFINKIKTKQEKQSKPRYSGPPPPPNRFNIWPGYRYDSVDRSNGFEKRRFLEINKTKTYKEAAYKWSVEEM